MFINLFKQFVGPGTLIITNVWQVYEYRTYTSHILAAYLPHTGRKWAAYRFILAVYRKIGET